ncbi:MAG: polysaccharide biosynthesis tyrosine autokinase [Elusimicrobiota bacterium]
MADPLEDLAADIDLRHYVQVLLRRRWIVISVFLVILISAAIQVHTTIPIFKSTAMILIEKERSNQGSGDGTRVETTADDYYQTQYKLLRSRSLMRKVHGKLALDNNEEFPGIDALLGTVTITPIRQSRLVNVAADSQDPQLATNIANTIAELFVEENVESKLYISREILNTLFPKDSARRIDSGDRIKLEDLPAVVNSQLIQEFKGDYARLETKKAELSGRYTPENPKMLRLDSQMQSLKRQIEDETQKIVRGMKAELSGQLLGNNVRIVDPAEVPKAPYKPRKARTLLVAALLGLIGGYLLALGIDLLDQTLHTQEDIERRLKLSFLGAVPMAILKSDSARDYNDLLSGPKSFTGESLKNIRTMIGFAAAGKPMKSILITSTGQGEGKTFIAMSLAMVFAQLGERVLLVEGDLRRPSLHKRFHLSKEKGLSHFLAHGKDTQEISGLIQSPEHENLDVLVCGHLPPNPSELLSTPRTKAAIEWATQNYDRVIIDGTPVFPITDALLWSRHCDTTAFVVKFGSTHSGLARKAIEKLNEGDVRIAGAVVNQVTARTDGYYGGYYYYYYYYHSDYTDAKKSLKA